MSKRYQLAELQLAIMQVLWERDEATVGEVRDALETWRSLAYTTVGTMLTKMEEKGYVTHRSDGRTNVFRPVIRRDQVSRSMVLDLSKRLFAGDITQMVSHLLDGNEVTRQELAKLKKMIREREQRLRHDH